MEEIYSKLKNGERLSEKEIRYLVWDSDGFIEEIEGDDHRWQKEMQTIIDVDGQLYAIDWMRGLTECQENEYLEQPYKVKKVEKVIPKTEITYEPEGE